MFKLASNPHRFEILRLLEVGPRTVSGLLEEFTGDDAQLASRHLGHLRVGGLVDSRTDGQFRVYSLTERGRRLTRTLAGLGSSRGGGVSGA